MGQAAKIAKRLESIGRGAAAVADGAVEMTAHDALGSALRLVPRLSGALSASLRVSVGFLGAGAAIAAVPVRGLVSRVVGTDDPKAIHLEYGTQHSAAQPFLRPVVDGEGQALVAAMKARILAGLEGLAR